MSAVMTPLLPIPAAPASEPRWARIYLQELEVSGLRASACAAAGVTSQRVTKYASACIEFAEAQEAAEERFNDSLEAEAIRRGRDGVVRGVYYQGNRIGDEVEYSDSMLSQLLKGRRRNVFGDKKEVAHTGSIQVVLDPVAQFIPIDPPPTTTPTPKTALPAASTTPLLPVVSSGLTVPIPAALEELM